MLDTELFVDTWWYKDGLAAGKADGTRAALLTVLNKKFPDTGPVPELDRIADPATLDSLLSKLLDAATADEFRAAVAAALTIQ